MVILAPGTAGVGEGVRRIGGVAVDLDDVAGRQRAEVGERLQGAGRSDAEGVGAGDPGHEGEPDHRNDGGAHRLTFARVEAERRDAITSPGSV